ncbi:MULTISPECIES: hypothetical protein [unclassified Streptomyces]|uniref:hypothetical protein n=1 Tax=unclassified Streptomyces TaxID=2593676 RepID=UPI0016519CF4|nr:MULTISPECIES: hypothetical protein [unclassified Streptomyces]
MSHARTHSGYRTGGLWAAMGISFAALIAGSAVALFAMLEFDERCTQGITEGPGRLLRTRSQAFPPATVCEYTGGGVVSFGGHGVLALLLWSTLLIMVACLFLALLAECFDPLPGSPLVMPMTRTEKLRRTGTALTVTGSLFLLLYALAGWKLLVGPSGACSAGADWGSYPPRTLEYSFFPPQATCQYGSGMTERMNPDWVASLTAQSAAPALLAAVGFALAWRRWSVERTALRPGAGPAAAPAPAPDREDAH